MASQAETTFVPALIVVDMQEDFCPPNGSLAVQGGRTIAPLINTLLSLPAFKIRIGTQDWHPQDHISFASNHPPPNNDPFESYIEMTNPAPGKQNETKPQRLWPVHCVASTPGAEIIPEIVADKLDILAKKGMDTRVEMYSVFSDAFQNMDPSLFKSSVDVDVTATLKQRNVTDVFVVGLAGDYCVKYTAIDAARAGFRSFVVEDAVKSVDPGEGWKQALKEFEEVGVKVVKSDGPEVGRVRS
ncbi:isochorismatase family hydrolase, putative [Talaromyces stipitatus ATCC 10500]|uniref:nicotinamidase n=1 Tax=Talaromyces stipitatus (strain ATCC 10500 / CBS 375.48 / QM 6759 / NRRL 1006) TaxID=441959 RepID=B8M8F4_TALSN|nr:isochorismatase family hydrolase, putative [Talaromyces stipitatus ATCC 10500]EED20467.1 isochorismatase family hydrolase, putative [Talaromyces stipitatus ATCC 10500]